MTRLTLYGKIFHRNLSSLNLNHPTPLSTKESRDTPPIGRNTAGLILSKAPSRASNDLETTREDLKK